MADFHLPEPPIGCAPNFELQSGADGLMTAIHDTMQASYTATQRARAAAEAALGNELETPAKRHQTVRDLSSKIIATATTRHDRVAETLRHEIARLDKLTRMPPRPADARDQLRSNEICAALRTMDRKARRAALMDAIKAGTGDEGVSAILNMPAYVAGMSETEAEEIRTAWRAARYPEQCSKLAELRRLQAHFDRSGTLLVGYSTKLYNQEIVDSGERSQRMAQRAISEA